MLEAIIETIDEKKAAEYLTRNKSNRPYHQPYTSILASKQERGEWQTNGDSIRFDSNGDLRDGQHRLKMVLQTGKPIELVVVRGINPDSFITIDTGKKRSFADVLSIEGEANPAKLASGLVWLRRYLINNMTGGTASHEQYKALLNEHPGLRDSVTFYSSLDKGTGYPYQMPLIITSHYLLTHIDLDKANDFIERFVTGLRLEDVNDPVARLRGQVNTLVKGRASYTTQQYFGIYAFAWNAYRAGRKVTQNFKIPTHRQSRYPFNGFPSKLLEVGYIFRESENNGEAE